MVTVTPHLRYAVGVLVVSEDAERGVFKPVLEAETAVPTRRTVVLDVPKAGGDVLVKVCEGVRHIKISKKERDGKANGKVEGDEEEEGDESEEEDEDEEFREKVWKVGKVLAEAGVKGVKKGGKVEVMVNVGGELGVLVTAREVGGKGGVRGSLGKPGVVENGKA